MKYGPAPCRAVEQFQESLSFKLNLSGSDIGMLLVKFETDADLADEPSDANPVQRETSRVTTEVEGRLRTQIEAAIGTELVDKFTKQASALFEGAAAPRTRQRFEITFDLAPRDVGVMLVLASGALDDADQFLSDDEEGEWTDLARAYLSMYRGIHRGIGQALGPALAADLEEQVSHLWAGAIDELLEERNWRT